jgi:hypothetical protein
LSLKEEFLSLLEKDKEFRYAVAGFLGLEEILKRLDKHEEIIEKLREDFKSLRKDFIELREDFKNLRKDFISISEEQIKISKELAILREEQTKLREEQIKIGKELLSLREEQIKISKEIATLGEEQIKLREDFNKMLEVIKELQVTYYELREGQKKLWDIYESFRASMLYGFSEVSKFAGITFEEFVRNFLSEYLRKLKILPEGESLKKAIIDKEEINMFFEDPLIVGEITSYAENIEEIEKLLRKIEIVRKKYNKEPKKFLIILTVSDRSLAEDLKKKAKENEVELIIGKISEKY